MWYRGLCIACLLTTFTPLSVNALDFHGEPCTVDCSGHKAGYDWAEEKGINDPDDCGGKSNSFIEGCKSFAEEKQEEISNEEEESAAADEEEDDTDS